MLPTHRKDARIDATTTYFPGEPLSRQTGLRTDLDNISTKGVTRGYAIGIYTLGISEGRLAAVEFVNKKHSLSGVRKFLLKSLSFTNLRRLS